MKTYTYAGYFAHCPALPGCFGTGLTIEETKEDMKGAIALHLESLRVHGDLPLVDSSE